MKKYFFYVMCVFAIFMCNFVQAATINNFENVTEKVGNVIVVKKGTIIEYLKDGTKLSVDNSQVAIVEGQKIMIADSGRFNVVVEIPGNEMIETYQFFAWNAYLKSGRYWTYKDENRKTKSEVLYSKTYLDLSKANKNAFLVEDYVFKSGSYRGELKGKYITTYYNESKDKSTTSAYEYAMKSDFKVPENSSGEEHTHQYTIFVKKQKESTCTEKGVSVYKCEKCDMTQNKEEKMLEHVYTFKTKNEKEHERVCTTCGKVSSTLKHTFDNAKMCTACGYIKVVHEHKFENLIQVKQEATCEKNGIKVYKCTGCDKTKEVKENKLGHDYKIQVKDENKHQKVCNRCGKITSTTNHTYDSTKKCTVCGYEKVTQISSSNYFKNITEKVGNTIIVKKGTIVECVKEGARLSVDDSRVAVVDGQKIKIVDSGRFNITVEIPGNEKLETYQFFAWNTYLKSGKFWVYKDANKSSKDYILYSKTYLDLSTITTSVFQVDDYVFNTGSYAGDLVGKYITSYYDKAKDKSTSSSYEYAMKTDFEVPEKPNEDEHTHQYTIFVKTQKESTCTEKGVSVYKCEKCDITQNKEEKLLEHMYTFKNKNEKEHQQVCDNCSKIASTSSHTYDSAGKCTACGYVKVVHVHKFETLVGTKQEATCRAEGIKIYQCTGCTETQERKVAKLEHVYGIKSKDENKHQRVCNLCGAVGSEEAHKFDTAGKCECGYIQIVPITSECRKPLQTHLKALGYYNDSIDGVFGKNTRNAINQVLNNNGFGRTLSSNSSWKDVDTEMYNFIMAQTEKKPGPSYVEKTAAETKYWKQKWIYYEDENHVINPSVVIIYLHGDNNNGTAAHPYVYDELNMPKDTLMICPILSNSELMTKFYDKYDSTTKRRSGTRKLEGLIEKVSSDYPNAIIIIEGHSSGTQILSTLVAKDNTKVDGYAFYSPFWDLKKANKRGNCLVVRSVNDFDGVKSVMESFESNPEINNIKQVPPISMIERHGAVPEIITTSIHWDWVEKIKQQNL